jgi:hypothetical protein
MRLFRAPTAALLVTTATLTLACTTDSSSRAARAAGTTVQANGRDYVVIACPGAQSAGITCPNGFTSATYYRGGVVCQRAGGGESGGSIPASLCEGFVGGCTPASTPPAVEAMRALDDGERARITAAGFRVVACGANSFRLDSTAMDEAPAPVVEQPVVAPSIVAQDGGAAPIAAQEPVAPPPPQRVITEDPELVARTEALRTELMTMPGVTSGGVGVCATAPGETLPQGAVCVRIEVNHDGTRPDLIAERFRDVARQSGHPLRLSFEVSMPVPPRCTSADPECGPITSAGVCPDSLGIRPGGGRTPISTAVNAGMDLRAYEQGRCRSDGDCVIGGCGSHCVAAGSHGFASTCEGVSAIESAACGCVRGRCRWFVATTN